MSLVFLKNDTNNASVNANNHLKPWNWANYFDTPLVLPPDSQVAYISSTMSRDNVIDFPAPNNVLWLQTGNQQMNLPMPIRLDTSQGAETWDAVTNQITNNAYVGGTTDFMYDGLTGGLNATYNAATKKINIDLTQRLQPAVQGVWANRGGVLPASWTGLNDTGLAAAAGQNAGLPSNNIIAGGGATLWDCGWFINSLGGGGLPINIPVEYGNRNFTGFTTQTGIKRSSDNVALTGLGGEVHFRGDLDPAAEGATATSMTIPYIAGLNSLQAIRSVPQGAAANQYQAYVDDCVLNGGNPDTPLHPNVVQIRIENGTVFVEVMDVQRQNVNEQPNPGAWGNCDQFAAGTSPYGMKIVDSIVIDTWLGTPLTQPQNTGAEASQPYFNQSQAGVVENNYNKITFKIKWKTPYTFQIYMGTGYDDAAGKYEGTVVAGGNQYAPGTAYQDTYSIIYDSEFGGTYSGDLAPDADKTFFLPAYFGDLAFCSWLDRQNNVEFRGNFDVINCYPETPEPPYPSYDETLKGINGINMAEDTLAYPNCYHLKPYEFTDIFPALTVAGGNKFDDGTTLATNAGYNTAVPLLVCGIVTPTTPPEFQRWYPRATDDAEVYRTFAPPPSPDTNIGVVMGLIKASDNGVKDFVLPTANDIRVHRLAGAEEVGEAEIYNSVHIQLTNLPITGRNGMTSTKTSTIAVIHNALATVTVGNQNRKLYNHYTNEKNFIDLNNVAEMTLNELRVYISDDANRPANYLVDKSDVVVMFRTRPAGSTGVSRQVITGRNR